MQINKPVSSIIIIVVTLVLIFLFVFPKFQEFKDLKINLVKKQVEYDGESAYYERMQRTLSKIKEKGDALEKINSALPSEFTLASIVYFLQEKVRESGLVLDSMKFAQVSPEKYREESDSKKSPGKKIDSVSFNINLSGNYAGLKSFISSLEKSARLFEVETISFDSSQSLDNKVVVKNELNTYNYRLLLTTHRY